MPHTGKIIFRLTLCRNTYLPIFTNKAYEVDLIDVNLDLYLSDAGNHGKL